MAVAPCLVHPPAPRDHRCSSPHWQPRASPLATKQKPVSVAWAPTATRPQQSTPSDYANSALQVQEAIGSINVLDPTSEIARFEEKVRREEAYAMGQAELAASSLDAQFAELESAGADIEIEARLAALKQGASPRQIEATTVTPEITTGTQDA